MADPTSTVSAAAVHHRPPDLWTGSPTSHLHAFLGAARYGDDMTLVVLKWQGVPADAPDADARLATRVADGREPAAAADRWPAATHTPAPA